MRFSRKDPLVVTFFETERPKIKELHKEAYRKIQMYREFLAKDKDMSKEMREEIQYAIRKYRGQLRFNKPRTSMVKFSYKGIDYTAPTDQNGFIPPRHFETFKSKIREILVSRRQTAKKKTKQVKKIEGQYYEISGGVHVAPNAIADLFQVVAMKRVNSARKPDAGENHVGIEIEFFSGHSREDICQRLIDAKLSKYARIMTDRTIKASEEKPVGLELCVVAPESKYQEIYERACDVLSDIDAETNESCGFHVHLDSRNRNNKLLFHNLVNCQDLLFRMTYSSRKKNEYCQPQKSPSWDESDNSHYMAINRGAYSKHQTIEVRLHHGTINFDEVKNWVAFLIKIANYNEMLDKMDRVVTLGKQLKMAPDLIKYFQGKIKLFSA